MSALAALLRVLAKHRHEFAKLATSEAMAYNKAADGLDVELGISAETICGSRPPYACPVCPGRTEDGRRRWLRDHGPKLAAYGAQRLGTSGPAVTWTITVEGLRRC